MGSCGSRPRVVGVTKLHKTIVHGGGGGNGGANNNNNKRRRIIRRVKRKSHKHSSSTPHKNNRVEPNFQPDLCLYNPPLQGNAEAWFDTDAAMDSDWEDEFYSVQDDISQAGSGSAGVTPRFSNLVICGNGGDVQQNFDEPHNEGKSVSFQDRHLVQSQDETGRREEMEMVRSCGFLSNALLPCLACDECLDNKRKTVGLGGPGAKKRLSIATSFKWRDGHVNPVQSSPKTIVQRPIAGSQIASSPLEKKISESWSSVDPSNFKVRGRNFNKDKKKESALNYSAYVPFGVDVFLSPQKISHIARHVELPAFDSNGEIPTILIVNLQIPLYPAALFQNENDGAGMNFVFYFKLSDNYSELPAHFRENLQRIIANETEKIKGFPMDTNASFRERLKILGRVVNIDDLQLSSAERKLMHAYNEKPVLSRPQHEFHLGDNYLEIDLDIHRFSYIARKGFDTFQDRIKHCVFDFGLTIQGNKPDDLPECMLCCLRLKEIDHTNYYQLNI